MQPDTQSPLAALIQERIGEDPAAVIAREHPGKSFRTIAKELSDAAGVQVSREAIRRWKAEG